MGRPKARNWMLIVFILLAIFLMSSILANFSMIDDTPTGGNVALIPIKGVITSDGVDSFTTQYTSSTEIIKLIEKAKAPRIKAVIFEINSPGGSAVASEEIANAILELNKTSVAWIREVGASGAYWAASATDHIVASRMSATGSIGVLSSYLDFSEFIQRYNISYQRLVAGKYKDSGSPFKELTDEEKEMFEDRLELVHEYFIDAVRENRNMDNIDEFAEGQVYLGSEALDIGLIDQIGSKQEAIEYIETELNMTAEVVEYTSEKSLLEVLGSLMSRHGFSIGKGITDMNDGIAIKT